MIDEDRTMQLFLHTSDELSLKSDKKIVAVCDECGTPRVVQKRSYKDLCVSCAVGKSNANRVFAPDYNVYSIDDVETFDMFGHHVHDLALNSVKKVVAVCVECGESRVIQKRSYSDLCPLCGLRKSNKKRAAPPDAVVRSIDDAATFKMFGHHAYDLSPSSNEKVVAVCTGCGARRVIKKNGYKDLCLPCANTSEEKRKRVSATFQGIQYDDWETYATDSPYCPHFNNACKESNREEYDRRCFLSGMTEDENGKKLSVHHIDMNKAQGCDGHAWKLVPLSVKWHGRTHNLKWQARIQYLLNYVWVVGRNNNVVS